MKQTEQAKVKVHIFSPGGSGLEFLKSKFTFANHHLTPHQRGVTLPPEDKFIYLYGHPYDILKSFGRRFLLWHCVQNLQGDLNALGFINHDKRKITLSDYLENGVDCFRFWDHFNAFAKLGNEKLLVKYEALADAECMNRIAEFIGAEPYNDMPLNQRHDSELSEEQIRQLQNMHGGWAAIYETLPLVMGYTCSSYGALTDSI